MHPQVVSDEPGICPTCQMALRRVDEPAAAEPSGVAGRAAFTLSPERQQLIGVTRGRVERRPLAVEVRAVGTVAYDPTLYQAIVEYREAVRARRDIKDSPWVEAKEGADALVRAAQLKLRQQGVSPAQLPALAAGTAAADLLLPGKRAWVYAQVYEHELALVHPGQEAIVTVPSRPDRTLAGRVVTVDPVLDPKTRTARARVLVPTPDADLRPEMFVRVRLVVPLGDRLAVPDDAVLDTGEHQIVFVVTGEGAFAPRTVRLGHAAQGWREVLDGLAEGEDVVTSANFLIDSESRFRAAALAGSAAGHVH
jgi:Cu(I)/Ag(I) efflux system membrane fusion protein